MKNSTHQRGVAILFAILLVSIVLTVGLTILNITLRQLVLSSLARESQFAFYAADSARSCARHYDSLMNSDQRPFGYFGLSGTGELEFKPPMVATAPLCGSGSTSWVVPFACSGGSTSPCSGSFTALFDDGLGKQTCAKVVITKGRDTTNPHLPPDPNPEYGMGKTKIQAYGYNNYAGPGANCYQITDRTVERALEMVY